MKNKKIWVFIIIFLSIICGVLFLSTSPSPKPTMRLHDNKKVAQYEINFGYFEMVNGHGQDVSKYDELTKDLSDMGINKPVEVFKLSKSIRIYLTEEEANKIRSNKSFMKDFRLIELGVRDYMDTHVPL